VPDARVLDDRQHGGGFRAGSGERLGADDPLARGRGDRGRIQVRLVRQCDDDQVDGRVSAQRGHVVMRARAPARGERRGAPAVARVIRHQPRALGVLERFGVRRSDEP